MVKFSRKERKGRKDLEERKTKMKKLMIVLGCVMMAAAVVTAGLLQCGDRHVRHSFLRCSTYNRIESDLLLPFDYGFDII